MKIIILFGITVLVLSGLSYKVWDDIRAMEGYRKGAYRLAIY